MNKVLNKRILRDLGENFTRYLALLFMIIAGMFIVIAVVGAAETVISGTHSLAEKNKVEEGQFSVFLPLTEEQENELSDSGVTVERMFSADMKMADGSTLRFMKIREKINLIHLDSGALPKAKGEAVIEKRYSEEHGISIGDSVEIGGVKLTATGIGSVPEYDMPIGKFSDTAVESSLFGLVFVTAEQYDEILGAKPIVEEYCYAYRLNDVMTHDELKEKIKAFDGAKELYNGTNLTSFIKAEDNPRIYAAANDLAMNKTIGLVAGVIIMILFTYVISVFVIYQIQRESSVIGTLYALGAKKKDLIRHYIKLPTIICFIGGLIGSGIGFSESGISWQMTDCYNYFSIPDLEPVYPIYLIIYAVVMPPVISAVVNYLVINNRLSRTALSLIRNEQKISHRSKVSLSNMGFIRRFQIRQLLREARTGITVVFGMFICMLVFMLGMNCYVLCQNIKVENAEDTKFTYMYNLKYPEENAPANAEACYMESLSKTDMGYTLDVNIIGVDDDNKYYSAKPVKRKNSIVISSSVAQKYGLFVDDKLILSDRANDMDYVFTVDGIADYSVGLSVFMDIDSMRELFDKDEDYYNMLLSDEELDIDEGRVYSVTTKADIEQSSAIFVEMMKGMFTMLITMSVLIFCVVMYLMMNVMIDRASFGISLAKIFGFRTKEIRKLYLNGNAVMVAVGAIITIPLSKFIMDSMYPSFIANTACGMNLIFPWYMYALIFGGVMLFYFIVSTILVGKLKRITSAEVLKNRE